MTRSEIRRGEWGVEPTHYSTHKSEQARHPLKEVNHLWHLWDREGHGDGDGDGDGDGKSHGGGDCDGDGNQEKDGGEDEEYLHYLRVDTDRVEVRG